jgi:hypothetical protein
MAIQAAGNFHEVAVLTEHVMARDSARPHYKEIGIPAVQAADVLRSILLLRFGLAPRRANRI